MSTDTSRTAGKARPPFWRRSLPAALVGAAIAVALEAVLLTGLGLYLVFAGLLGAPHSRAGAESAAALAILAGVGLALVTRGLLRARRWARAPALLALLCCLPVTAYGGLIQGGRASIGVPILVVAVLGLVLLFAPASIRALDDEG